MVDVGIGDPGDGWRGAGLAMNLTLELGSGGVEGGVLSKDTEVLRWDGLHWGVEAVILGFAWEYWHACFMLSLVFARLEFRLGVGIIFSGGNWFWVVPRVVGLWG
ncbi:hypothetical protein KM043_005694 [Ampulex compressa]|nr:hypothetical protein KM043_005694 [Ampulex compressa]